MGYLLPGLLVIVLIVTVKSDDYDLDIENTLRTLLSPDEYPTIQLQALRRSILQRLINRIDEEQQQPNDLDDLVDRWNKRNLEALARAGLVRTLPLSPQDNDGNNNNNNNDDDESNLKRSLSSLIKNGQLPQTYQNSKRGIQSLARNGELIQHRSNFDNTNDEYDFYKRNVASLARNFNLPSTYGKRFVGSLAKSGDLRFGKRNIASIARDGIKIGGGKRSLQSIKAQMGPNHRQKRQIDYYDNNEYPTPVYQNQNVYDYEELMKALTGVYPNTEKRFLGSVAKSGWFRPSSPSRFYQNRPEKRHIGALARLGWLPAFRNVRRFNRSGRSTEYYINNNNDNNACSRSSTANGQAEDDTAAENSLPLDNKRYLLQPAVDNILLRRMIPHHPRTHGFITELS